jgi:cytokinin dehydrogenase
VKESRKDTRADWTPGSIEALRVATGLGVATDFRARRDASRDFGRIVRGASAGVVRPRTVDDVAAVLAFASEHRLAITPRGHGGSGGGQSVARGGLTLDLNGLDRVSPPDARRDVVVAEGGAPIRAIVDAAMGAPTPRIPRVLPLYLQMTAGGLLSAGGVGSTSHRYGPVIANVRALDVVTGDGRIVSCSREMERPLFDAALGGLGRYGVIARATFELRPVTRQVRTVHLVYDDPERWLDDQRALVRGGGFDHLEGFCWMGAKGLRTNDRPAPFAQWLFGLQIGFSHDGDAAAGEDVLRDLHPWRRLAASDDTVAAHARRYTPRFEAMHASGAWEQSHPWVEYFVPSRILGRVLPPLLDRLHPSLGDGHRVMFVDAASARASFGMPDGDEIACFAILPMGIPAFARRETLAALREVDAHLLEAGAKRYLSGWGLPPNDAAWRAHHGPRAEALRAARAKYDPAGVLGSALFSWSTRASPA